MHPAERRREESSVVQVKVSVFCNSSLSGDEIFSKIPYVNFYLPIYDYVSQIEDQEVTSP